MVEILRGRYDGHHEVFTALPEDAVLWRYMDLTKLLALLEDRALWFTRSDLLGDPFEGSLTAIMNEPPTHVFNVNKGEVEDIDPALREGMRKLNETMRPQRLAQRRWISISCWNNSTVESDALWGRYVHAEHGIAIRSTFGRLARSFGEPLPPPGERPTPPPPDALTPVYIGRVSYVDYAHAVWPPGNLFWPYVHKRLSFAHEAEVRALVMQFPKDESGGLDYEAEMAPGVLLAVDLAVLIEAIYVSPVAPEWLFVLVKRICQRYGVAADVKQSDLAATPIF